MHDDYLWDGTGELDDEGAQMLALQRTLAPLRYEPEAFRIPRSAPAAESPFASSRWLVPVVAAVVAAAAVLVLGLGSRSSPADDVDVVVVSAQTSATADTEPAVHEFPGQLPPVSGSEGAATALPAKTATSARLPERSKATPPDPKPPRAAKPRRERRRTSAPSKRSRRQPRTKSPQRAPVSVDCILDPTGCPNDGNTKARPRSRDAQRNGVDCMLDPALCRPGGTKDPSPRSADKMPSVDCVLDPSKCEPLPETLTSADLRAGMRLVKSRVLACGPKHHAPGGQKVKVKLGILGATGRVLDATAMGTASDTPLGRCVEKAASKARFPRFKRARLGAVYPFTMPGSKTTPKTSKSAETLMQEVSGRVNVKARGCALVHDVPSGTKVDVELTVSSAGKVTKVRLLPRDSLSSDASRCLNNAIRKLVVSPSAAGVRGRIPVSL